MREKKEEEFNIMEKFINAYTNKYSINDVKVIKDVTDVRKQFPEYTGENPDFIALHNDNYIGVELFELTKNVLEPLNKNIDEQNLSIKNSAHLHSIRKKNDDHSLYLMEDLAEVAIERINDKIKNKLDYSVQCPIWLIGYANKPYNLYLLNSYVDDGTEKLVSKYISTKILDDDRVEKIWLGGFWKESVLLNIK